MYFVIFTVPVFMGFTVWQSTRFSALNREAERLEAVQKDLVEKNKQLIAEIAIYSSSERIESVAVRYLGLSKVQPENVLQISIKKKRGQGN
jgi:cell division protein FtsL